MTVSESRPTALVFSANLDGHRQVWAAILADVLVQMGFHVVIAGQLTSEGRPLEIEQLAPHRGNPRVKLLHVEDALLALLGTNPPAFRKLQEEIEAEVTIFAEADNHLSLLSSQVVPGVATLRGRRVGLFLRDSNYIYPSPASRDLRQRLRRIRHLPEEWRNDPVVFHEFLLPRFRPLDAALTLDEYYVAGHRKTHQWLPDPYRPFGREASEEDVREDELWAGAIDRFLAQNGGRFVFLYFGTAQERRGYDTLLKLAVEENGCFIHCGRRDDSREYRWDVAALRDTLSRDGAILETHRYIVGELAIRRFFTATDRIVLPYRRHMGSSGVMLYAISFGRPVLVPDEGLMARRVRDHALGMTYCPDDFDSLRSQFRAFQRMPAAAFRDTTEKFGEAFAEEKIVAALQQALSGQGIPVAMPDKQLPSAAGIRA